MKIHDISRPLSPATAPWPGDQHFELEWALRIEANQVVNLSSFRMSPHVGTHTDAPLHVVSGGGASESLALEAYFGPARVLDVAVGSDLLIHPHCLDGVDIAAAPRILFRTGTDPDPTRFPETFAAFAPSTCRELAERGAVLVGIDTPSVDPADSKTLAAHHALLAGELHWIENLDLSRVGPGVYELAAFPLAIVGACASPVRAVLIER
ncbi:MAG: cyclase family protein [Candidatus Eisenbacteria bacterium]|uniref:Kynurenine formamidase n=1 Tax=Eiseniibacteriota bacterium TaxID=2212470 RepID=A0A956SDK1_UNCEI|nr:cyclase family protein [Candidatus Eisenbacteria bacterium]MCB9463442.1 cyclase family protein [Candidatus Eisenbacteria bacterium]